MAKIPKINELSAREDFIIQSFADMKKINTIAGKLFNLYFIDVDRNSELTPLMRTMVPPYYIDPTNPEHPGCYILAGQSSIEYLERIAFVAPYVNEKNKYEFDLSGWKGLLIKPGEFQNKVKGFRKTKLEPMCIMGERNGERYNQSLILRESDSHARDEIIVPFLQTPSRKREGEDAYQQALQALIYTPFYQYLMGYMRSGLKFEPVSQDILNELCDADIAEFISEDGDRIAVTKSLFPTVKNDQRFSIAKVSHPDIDTSGGRFHYVVMQEYLNDHGSPYVTIYTLLAALQLHYDPSWE